MDVLELRTEVALDVPTPRGRLDSDAGAEALSRTDGPGAVRTRDVRLGPEGFFVDGERIAETAAIWSVEVARRGDTYVLLVRHDVSGKQSALVLASAREVVAFLAHLDGLSRRRFDADILIRPFATKLQRHAGPVTAAATFLVARLLGVDIGPVLVLASLVGIVALVGYSLFASRPLLPTTREGIEIGREGIVIERSVAGESLDRRFVSFGEIASIEERRRVVRFVLRSRELVDLRVNDDREREQLRFRVMAGMANVDAVTSRGDASCAVVEAIAGQALARARVTELAARLDQQRAEAGGYRGAPLDLDALARVLSDPSADASRRAIAAALLRGTGEEAIERIRVAADAAVEPKVRVALEEASQDATTTEAILAGALDEADDRATDARQNDEAHEPRARALRA